MRIVSQNYKYDFPYEEICLKIKEEYPTHIYVYGVHDPNKAEYDFANYSTEEKTLYMLALVRKMYEDGVSAFVFPKESTHFF